jgi:hypothetical protein
VRFSGLKASGRRTGAGCGLRAARCGVISRNVDAPEGWHRNVAADVCGISSFSESVDEPPIIEAGTQSLHSMPRLRTPDDRFTAITRLRFVLEDPRQLLSNSVAHFVIDQLCENGYRPGSVVIPSRTSRIRLACWHKTRARSQLSRTS